MTYQPAENRYYSMRYNRCGNSGLFLPAIALGGWYNFTDLETTRKFLWRAFDVGITHIDLANNYGPPPGIAEENVGRVLKEDFAAYRDELIISTKAGYRMWPGPYGEWGSKKYLVASLDQSLRRLQLDYVDIFYSHRMDPDTPLTETMSALDWVVRQGKALYAGISNYNEAMTCEAAQIMNQLGTPLTIHQCKYSMLQRNIEAGVLHHTARNGMGMIAFSPLHSGLLTSKYLNDIPADSRAATQNPNMANQITPEIQAKLTKLNDLAQKRGQSLAQMALAWALHDPRMTSLVIGISRLEQLDDNLASLHNLSFDDETLQSIETILK
ncbi:MAG: aldo/keto reductase [Chloroflexota bacterium]